MTTIQTNAKKGTVQVECNSKHFAQVKEGVRMANELLGNEEFYSRIAGQPWFELANVSPEVIASLMRTTKIKMTVDLYYAMSSVHNIDGYDDFEKSIGDTPEHLENRPLACQHLQYYNS